MTQEPIANSLARHHAEESRLRRLFDGCQGIGTGKKRWGTGEKTSLDGPIVKHRRDRRVVLVAFDDPGQAFGQGDTALTTMLKAGPRTDRIVTDYDATRPPSYVQNFTVRVFQRMHGQSSPNWLSTE